MRSSRFREKPMPTKSVPGIGASKVVVQRRQYLLPVALAGSAFAALVLIMWGAFNLESGLGYETAFPYMSETGATWWRGFFYVADSLRIHTNTFYHLSYLLSAVLGIRGSYLPYQIVYALLWWGRGMLVFLILRRFLGAGSLMPYVAGALVIVHSSDGALQWVGQLNQFGFIFWMLLAFYLLTIAATASTPRNLPLLLGACFFEYMSLWSYESQLPIILVYPLALLLLARGLRPGWKKWCGLTAAWYLVPGAYLWITLHKYLRSAGVSYQESVMRTGWSAISLASDWWFNIAASLEFWTWRREPIPPGSTTLLSILAALAFIATGVAIVRIVRERDGSTIPARLRTYWVLLAAGVLLVALSFPVYLLLGSARGLWRTQFLSGIGSGIVWTAALGLASMAIWKKTFRPVALLVLGAVIVYFGTESAITKGAVHRNIWDRHRAVMVEILRIAPSVKPGTVVVLTDVPKNQDPFGHNMWFDLAIRLSYPGIAVAGVYYYADGSPSPGDNMEAGRDGWKMEAIGMPTLVQETSLANTIVIDWNPAGSGHVEKRFPGFVCHTQCEGSLYDPASVITGPISPVAVNRYHP
jgi:hypothetical protein